MSCKDQDDQNLRLPAHAAHAAFKCLNLTLCCSQALETFMGIGINLVSVSMNYTAPAEAIYNIVISKPTPALAQHHPRYSSNNHNVHTFRFMIG